MSLFMDIGNNFMKLLLQSPFHGMLSKDTLIISYQGRKSGKAYTVPVNYAQEGNQVRIVSFKHRVWWKNLLGGPSVTLQIRGKEFRGRARVKTEEKEVIEGLADYLKPMPKFAKYFDIRLEENNSPNPDDLKQAAESRVIIEITLEE